jgi:hypothetical protein
MHASAAIGMMELVGSACIYWRGAVQVTTGQGACSLFLLHLASNGKHFAVDCGGYHSFAVHLLCDLT